MTEVPHIALVSLPIPYWCFLVGQYAQIISLPDLPSRLASLLPEIEEQHERPQLWYQLQWDRIIESLLASPALALQPKVPMLRIQEQLIQSIMSNQSDILGRIVQFF